MIKDVLKPKSEKEILALIEKGGIKIIEEIYWSYLELFRQNQGPDKDVFIDEFNIINKILDKIDNKKLKKEIDNFIDEIFKPLSGGNFELWF